jgi:tripartite-type tricarboxylate transporter receptor subunit TctC
MSLNRRDLVLGAGSFALASPMSVAYGQETFPSKPLKLVVPFAPGGGGDVLARLITSKLGSVLGQQVIVDNRAGAGGAIGSQVVARAEADGYTALIQSGTLVINPLLSKSAGYDFRNDFSPVVTVAQFPLVLVVHPSLPVKTMPEFLAYARAKGSELFFGSAGNGSTQHLVGELFNSMAGTKMTHVPFKGNGPATASLLAGDIQVMFDIVPSALSYRDSGKLRPLAVTGGLRSPVLADLPTLQETGVPKFDFSLWYAIFLPKGAPVNAVQQWNRAIDGVRNDKELQARLAAQGFLARHSSPAELKALMERDWAMWGKVIADARIMVE